jgi:hypothetical protein
MKYAIATFDFTIFCNVCAACQPFSGACAPYSAVDAPVPNRARSPIPGEVTLGISKAKDIKLRSDGIGLTSNDCRLDAAVNATLLKYGIVKIIDLQSEFLKSDNQTTVHLFFLIFPENVDTYTVVTELSKLPYVTYAIQDVKAQPG